MTHLQNNTFKIAGYAAIFEVCDTHNDTIDRGAFDTVLCNTPQHNIPLLLNHNNNCVIGHTTLLRQDRHGLYMEAQIMPRMVASKKICATSSNKYHSTHMPDLYYAIINGFLRGLSIGFNTTSYSYDKFTMCRHITCINLREISIVPLPANTLATIQYCDSTMQTHEQHHPTIVTS